MKNKIFLICILFGSSLFSNVAFAGYPGLEIKNSSENKIASEYFASETYFEDLYSVHDLINFLQSRLILKSVHLKVTNSQNGHSGGHTDFEKHIIEIRIAKDPSQCNELCLRQILAKQLIRLVVNETADPAFN